MQDRERELRRQRALQRIYQLVRSLPLRDQRHVLALVREVLIRGRTLH